MLITFRDIENAIHTFNSETFVDLARPSILTKVNHAILFLSSVNVKLSFEEADKVERQLEFCFRKYTLKEMKNPNEPQRNSGKSDSTTEN